LLLRASPLRDAAILFALWLMVFTSASQTIIVTPILPLIGAALRAPESHLGWLVTAYAWALAASALVMGPVSDRVGRRRVLLLGAGTLTVVLALHGLARSFEAFLAVRLLAGAGGGMLSGAAVSFVGDYFPYEKRGKATGWVMSGIAFGLVLGIPLGRVLAAAFDFRVPFLAFSALMGVAFTLIFFLVPQPDVEREAEALSVGGALRRYAGLFERGPVRVAVAVYFLMFLSLGLFVTYLPQWLTEHFSLEVSLFGKPLRPFGLPVDFIATLFTVGGLASVAAGPTAGALSDRVGRRPLILTSCTGLLLVTVAVTYLVTERWVAYVLYVAVMMLFAMRMTPLQALLTALVPARLRGTLLSLAIAVGQVGTGLGASLAGQLYAHAGYRTTTFASAAALLAMTLLVWWALPEPDGQAQEVAPVPASASVG